MARPSHQPFGPSPAGPRSAVAAYAAQKGWTIGRRNLLLEGSRDVAYCELAASLYARDHGVHLIDSEFRVISAGLGDEGGVTGVMRELINLYGLMRQDRELPRPERVRILPMFDDDKRGRDCFQKVTDPDFPFKPYEDVFLLKRAYPPMKLGAPTYTRELVNLNAPWNGIDCEIEDLLSREFLDAFSGDNPGALRCDPVLQADGHHYELTDDGKARLLSFTREWATTSDLAAVVRLLQYFRGLFDLPV